VARWFLLTRKPEVYFLIEKRILWRSHKLSQARMAATKQSEAKRDKLARRIRPIACRLVSGAKDVPYQVAAGRKQRAPNRIGALRRMPKRFLLARHSRSLINVAQLLMFAQNQLLV
jgi:hypothetical protein